MVGSLRTPETALLIAGRERLRPRRDDDIEIPLPQAVFVLRRVDHAHIHFHACALKRRFVEQDETLCRTIVDKKLDAKLLASLCINQFGVANFVSSLVK